QLASGRVVGVLAVGLDDQPSPHARLGRGALHGDVRPVVVAAAAQDQVLVLYNAVAVFVAFLAGLVAMARYSVADRSWLLLTINLAGAGVVVFTLGVNLSRVYPLASLVAAVGVGATLYCLWGRAGGFRGV